MNRFKLSQAQKDRIIPTMKPLRRGVTPLVVLDMIELAAERYLIEYYNDESMWKTLDSQLKLTPWRKRGAIKQESVRNYLTALELIHKYATGEWIGRQINLKTTHYSVDGLPGKRKQIEKPPAFIDTCFDVAHVRWHWMRQRKKKHKDQKIKEFEKKPRKRIRYRPRILQNVVAELKNARSLECHLRNADWLHPEAKQYLAQTRQR